MEKRGRERVRKHTNLAVGADSKRQESAPTGGRQPILFFLVRINAPEARGYSLPVGKRESSSGLISMVLQSKLPVALGPGLTTIVSR